MLTLVVWFSEWVHDKFEDYGNRRSGSRYRRSPDTSRYGATTTTPE